MLDNCRHVLIFETYLCLVFIYNKTDTAIDEQVTEHRDTVATG